MKTIRRQALLPFSAKQMFDLVDDIEKYPEFLPNCNDAKVLERTDDTVTATLSVAKGGFAKEFTTQNINQPFESIAMQLVVGPFKHLSGQWTFDALGDSACKIELVVKFEFSNPLTNLAFGAVFNQMAESFVDAFSKRAREVYT
ncbi:MAG: type II toxin-antitoxin system RatA family toxin [Kangiella sp.]|jgi:ribosome-associated toxin RatA of RatAB toxin-antitoxin module|nr:type II toxin-antitoxin system RatA family toxin [Kangiella sp.]MCW9029690.1 type II toxin-antitoxin system RatA family toxin [Kangiella sp.]